MGLQIPTRKFLLDAKRMNGESFYVGIDGDKWQYTLVTDPPAALYWNASSYKLKLTDIKIITKCSPEDRKRLRREIIKDIEGER